jgi:two-component system chemotaxis response regulator CheB
MIRVLVVEDSLTVRSHLVELLRSDPEVEVVGEAADGKRAIALCETLRPDVITLDMMRPVMNGLEVTEHIMAFRPTPILIVSSSTNRGELFKTYDALAAGAVHVLDKPSGTDSTDEWEQHFLDSVKLAARIKVITHPRARLRVRARSVPSEPAKEASVPTRQPASARSGTRSDYHLVAIGTSTGGPNALVDVVARLPPDFPLPILFVIHIGRPFAGGFADWLGEQCALRVRLAVDGEPLPQRGEARVVMAPPDVHLVVRGGSLRLTMDPERHSCRPSVDVLFESIARELGPSAIGCLLTGMGRDGAAGLLAMRRAGAMTLAQDERTSAVFGMPREAIQLDAAAQVLSLDEIGPRLVALADSE